jgi:hypothetical protein
MDIELNGDLMKFLDAENLICPKTLQLKKKIATSKSSEDTSPVDTEKNEEIQSSAGVFEYR